MATAPRVFRSPCSACLDCEVRSMAVCAALADNEVSALERVMISRTLEANQELVAEGDPRQFVYTLTSGMLRLSASLPDGRRQITGFLLPGDYLGLADDDIHSRTAEAVTASVLCAFPVDGMAQLQQSFPKLTERLHGMTKAALRKAQTSQVMLGRLTPLERLASFLVDLSRRAAEHHEPDSPVRLPMPRSDIADYLGLTVETISRSFTALKNAGTIGLPHAQLVEIIHRDRLEELAGVSERA